MRTIKFIQKRFYLCDLDSQGVVDQAFLIMPRFSFKLIHGMGWLTMARIIDTKIYDDDDTHFKHYFGFSNEKLNELIECLIEIRDGISEDDYLIIEDEEERTEIQLKFERTK